MGGRSQEARYLQQDRQQTDPVPLNQASPSKFSTTSITLHPSRESPTPHASQDGRGQLQRAAGTLPAAAQLPAEAPICQKGTASGHSGSRQPHGWQAAAHAHSGYTPRLRAHRHTRTHQGRGRRGRECGTDAQHDSEHRAASHPLRTRCRRSTAPPSRGGRGSAGSARGMEKGMQDGARDGTRPLRPGLPSAGTTGAHATLPQRDPQDPLPDRSTYPAILPLPLGSFARGTTRAFSPLPCRWREESCLFLCPAPAPSPASPAWPRVVGSPRSGRCLRPSAPLGLPAAAAEPRSTWRAAGRGRDGGGDRDAGDGPFAVPTAPRAAPRLRSRAAPPAPCSSLAAESGRQRAKPRRTAKVSGRRLAAAPRMVSAGGEGRRAVRSAQRPAGIPRRARGTGDRRLSAPRSPPHPVPGLRPDLPPTGAGGAESSAEAGERAAGRTPQEEEEEKGSRPRSPGCQRDPALRRQLQAPSRLPLALAAPGGDGGFYFWKPPPLCLFDADIPPLQRTRLGPPS